MEQIRKEYKWSICSTCTFLSFCELTKDKSNISSCSEYIHYMDGHKKKSLFERSQNNVSRTKKEFNNWF
ncbi:MAG: hypothetical protein DSY83_08255 [Flavobacteriia bacterium]|uniref:Uncharacterized protein n=1 Tax=Flagellimonas hadalis TaxID=2597517 RepID=A0A5N5INA9_9FLAO|nr:hypothetical protein FOT42_015610 [Allomuricauda hadalis]RUA15084.1 MAG: hypothetical protein DSY83_08255 [Flavobacteriia bacterium]